MSVLTVGSLYIENYGGTRWSQPGGVGSVVFPQQNSGFGYYQQPGKTFPLISSPINEQGQALWISPCGHGFDTLQVFRDFDSSTNMSAAVLTCPLCSFLIRLLEPYELVSNYLTNPILIP